MIQDDTSPKDTYLTRRENLRRIADQLGGNRYLAEKLGKKPSQISQLIGRRSHDLIQSKNIGNNLARDIERTLGLDEYFLDQAHHHEIELKLKIINEEATIPQTRASLSITRQARDSLSRYQQSVLIMAGDSAMRPDILPDDLLMCQPCPGYMGDTIYLIMINGHRYLRHVSRSIADPGRLILKGTDPLASEMALPADEVNFIARIIETWKRHPA